MAKNAGPNPFDTNKVVAAGAGQSNRGLVVNVMDPLKSGRVQIRVVGHHDDEAEIPDEKLPWVKIRNTSGTASLQTSTHSHGLLPGSMVTCEAMGQHGQDWLITGTIPNDRMDDNKTTNSAALGKDQTDKVHGKPNLSTAQKGDGSFAWKKPLGEVYKSKTTQEARQRRDTEGRDGKKSERDRVKAAHDEYPTTDAYQNRTTSKDPQGGTIGVFKSMGKDPQKFIQQTIQNKSAVVENALKAIQSLKKVNSNPTSQQSIGMGNFSAILSQLSQLFKSNGSSKEEQQAYDCAHLLNTPDIELTPEMLDQKQNCILLQNAPPPSDNDDPNIPTS